MQTQARIRKHLLSETFAIEMQMRLTRIEERMRMAPHGQVIRGHWVAVVMMFAKHFKGRELNRSRRELRRLISRVHSASTIRMARTRQEVPFGHTHLLAILNRLDSDCDSSSTLALLGSRSWLWRRIGLPNLACIISQGATNICRG